MNQNRPVTLQGSLSPGNQEIIAPEATLNEVDRYDDNCLVWLLEPELGEIRSITIGCDPDEIPKLDRDFVQRLKSLHFQLP